MRVSIIVAMAANGVIGRDNRLPWRLPADLRWFKRQTMGHPLVMGRKTFESIGRPLPGRSTVVITRQPDWTAEGVRVVHSLDEALATAAGDGQDEIFVAGGAEVFRQALPRIDRIYRTRIGKEIPGDTYFPPLDESEWRVVSEEHHEPNGENPYPYTFQVLDRA